MDKPFRLRPAAEADFPEIKALIHQVRINPMGLDWHHFTVADLGPAHSQVEGSGMIGCVQLKPVSDGLTELASLVVKPEHRHQGVAHTLIEHLLVDSPRPLYLTCRSSLGAFYEKFGFHVVESREMPRYYNRLQRLANTLMGFMRPEEMIFVMKLD